MQPATTRGLVRQDRPERRIFCDPSLGESPKISPFPVEGYSARVCMPSLWSLCSSQAIYEGHEAHSSLVAQVGNSVSHLPRRPPVYIATGKGLKQDMATAQYLLEKSREISVCSDTEVGVSGLCGEYPGYDSAPARLQGSGHKEAVHDINRPKLCVCQGPFQVNREIDGIYPSNLSCPIALQALSEAQASGPSTEQQLRCDYSPVPASQGGDPLVAGTPLLLE